MKTVSMNDARHSLAELVRLAEADDIVITENGKPVGVLIGLDPEDDLEDLALESDPRFAQRISEAHARCLRGEGVRLEDLDRMLSPESERAAPVRANP